MIESAAAPVWSECLPSWGESLRFPRPPIQHAKEFLDGLRGQPQSAIESARRGAVSLLRNLLAHAGTTDVQLRSDGFPRIQTADGLSIAEGFGRLSPLEVYGVLIVLFRCKSGPRAITADPDREDAAFLDRLANNLRLDFACDRGELVESTLPCGRVRVQCFFEAGGLALTIRALRDSVDSLHNLHFARETVARVEELILRRTGLCLVTGPTGSGKSTTLASLIESMRTRMPRHVVTIEDPIEYRFPETGPSGELLASLVTQQEVGLHVAGYRDGLVDALRKHPHVIVIGEIRDRSTMETALQAAQTGHLIVSTLHTRGAASTLGRILDFFRPEEAPAILTQLGETLTFIVSQGLYPSLREPGRQALCYEFLENTDSESRAAIRKYQENPTVLADWMKRPFNRRWEDTLRTLVESGEVSAAELRTGC